MIFPTIEFAGFFVVACTVSWLLMPHPRVWKPFIVVASYTFYGYADARFCLLLAASTVLNAVAGQVLARHRDRRILIAVLAANLGLLGWFKYFGFFVLSVDNLLERIGLGAPLPLLQVALPVGISFFTFQAVSYVLDIWRGSIRPVSLIDFAVYEAFFPHLVAGPIVRASEFLPQLRGPRNPRAVPATRAFFLIGGGLVKKVVIADLIATRIVDPVFNTPGQHSGAEILVAVYGYAVQIYCDFSAYSDMAIGLALLMGFRFPDNFNRPYAADSLQNFWRRWHMTLSRWLRDYLYIPLGGSKGGRRATYRVLMITMLLGGLWHGAAWTFVVWGAIHGGGLIAERWWADRRRRPLELPVEPGSPAGTSDSSASRGAGAAGGGVATVEAAPLTVTTPYRVPTALRVVLTFHLVCLAWIFFRSPDLGTAFELIGRLITWAPGSTALVTPAVLIAIAVGMLTQFLPEGFWRGAQDRFQRLSYGRQAVALGAFLVVLYSAAGDQGVSPFIYFRF